MAKCVSVLVHVVILCATSMVWAGPVTVFDLRYTLKIDTNDPVQVRMAWDNCHAVAALQGLVNRDAPRLYVRFVDSQHRSRNVDEYWLAKATAQGGWLEGSQIVEIDNIVNLVTRFDGFVRGAVVYDPAVAAAHVVRRIAQRRKEGHPPFHWFRNILKTPTWYVNTYDGIRKSNPKIELLDAPTFFELYRIYLKNHK